MALLRDPSQRKRIVGMFEVFRFVCKDEAEFKPGVLEVSIVLYV